jgi:hypothetical protein
MITRPITVDMRYAVEAMLRRIARLAWCTCCHEMVDWLTIAEAARLAETNQPILFMWIKTGRVHCLNARGQNLICSLSIQRGEAVTGELDRRRLE